MNPRTQWPRAVLHLDMDAFYANVHILDHPGDARLPLVVGGRPEERGVVASASYEARQFGIRSAMPTSTAVRLCPQVKIVPANWPCIREYSAQVMAVLEEFGPVEKLSVDEAYVDLSGWPDPLPLAQEIQSVVKSKTQLPASVGLATSKLVAKVASDYDKPEGCTVVLPSEEATFLAPLPVRVIWGIGPKTAERLAQMQIETCGQLAAADLTLLRRRFGNQATGMKRRAQGIDEREVLAERGLPKSFSQEWTFSQDLGDPNQLKAQLRQMSASVARSLQNRRLVAYTVRVKFRWADFTTFTRQKSVEVGVDSEEAIYRLAETLWEENWPRGQKVRLLGVGVCSLEESTARQLGFGF
ncbi:MAG TPA: DNA polymerase IV [Anaerolineae bacterium]